VAKKKFSGMSPGEDLTRPFDNPWDEFRQQEKDFVKNLYLTNFLLTNRKFVNLF
jgi:hypothetical protein